MNADLYQVLECRQNATLEELKKSYKRLVRENHPDRAPNSAEAFKAVTHAFDVLSDPNKRALYDRYGTLAVEAGFDPERLQRVGPGANIRASITLTFLEAVNGALRPILVGRRAGASGPVQVRFPPGVEHGQTLEVDGAGEPGRPPGKLLVSVSVARHPLFHRSGQDVSMTLPITVSEWIRGAQLPVPTPTGRVMITVPSKLARGSVLRVAGGGVAASNRSAAGDLLVKVQVEVPDLISDARGQALLDDLDACYSRPVRDGMFVSSPPESDDSASSSSPVDPPTLP